MELVMEGLLEVRVTGDNSVFILFNGKPIHRLRCTEVKVSRVRDIRVLEIKVGKKDISFVLPKKTWG